jgi:hypothetical protein
MRNAETIPIAVYGTGKRLTAQRGMHILRKISTITLRIRIIPMGPEFAVLAKPNKKG